MRGAPLMAFGTRLLRARIIGANSFRCCLKLESISGEGRKKISMRGTDTQGTEGHTRY